MGLTPTCVHPNLRAPNLRATISCVRPNLRAPAMCQGAVRALAPTSIVGNLGQSDALVAFLSPGDLAGTPLSPKTVTPTRSASGGLLGPAAQQSHSSTSGAASSRGGFGSGTLGDPANRVRLRAVAVAAAAAAAAAAATAAAAAAAAAAVAVASREHPLCPHQRSRRYARYARCARRR